MSVFISIKLSDARLVEAVCLENTGTTTDNLLCRKEYRGRRSGSVSTMREVGPRGKEKNCGERACWSLQVTKWPPAPPFLSTIHSATFL